MDVNLTELELDALREAGNIGAGHAAIALSQMVNKKIMIAVVKSDIVPSDTFLKNMAGGKDQMVVSVYLQTLGDIEGAAIFMFKNESALKLSDLLLFKEEGDTRFIDEKCQSAIKEAGSILTGAFFSVLADAFGLIVFNQAPGYAFDQAEIMLSGVCKLVFGDNKERLCLATEFIESSSQISGAFAFVPADESMDKILKKLDQKK